MHHTGVRWGPTYTSDRLEIYLDVYSSFTLATSYNQPRFSNYASWAPDAITITNFSQDSGSVTSIFLSKNNTWYAAVDYYSSIVAGNEGSMNHTTVGFGGYSLFIAGNDNVYSYDDRNFQVNVLAGNATSNQPVMFISTNCRDLFVDENKTLYCSLNDMHQVIAKSLDDSTNTLAIVAGTDCAGSSSDMLSYPNGIFVTVSFGLYVADSNNHRIQYFDHGSSNATTVAGNGASGTFDLKYPMDVVLDGDGYLFIVDKDSHRIIRSGPYGFRCVVGCLSVSGSASNQLTYPQSMSFDSDGNIWVADTGNGRIQKFIVNNVSTGEFDVLLYARGHLIHVGI